MSSEDSIGEKDYEVGYGRPPLNSRFKKGQSGNPRGSSAKRHNARSAFANPFQEELASTVEVQEKGKSVRRTLKHLGVRKLIEAAAAGDMKAIGQVLDLQEETEPSPLAEDRFELDLFEMLAAGIPEVMLYKPGVSVVRDPAPDGTGRPSLPSSNSSTKKKKRKCRDEPRDQTWKSLILFELERRVSITERNSGQAQTVTMHKAILKQLALAFASGKAGAPRMSVRLNKLVDEQRQNGGLVVHIPHDYVIPPRCDDPNGWPPGHPHHQSWERCYPDPRPSGDSSGA